MVKFKTLLLSILIPNLFGLLGAFLGNSFNSSSITQPSFSPPGFIFPIVWTILYTLMGISSYIIYESNSPEKDSALFFYKAQLIVNCLWTFFFFNLELFLFSFIWILFLLFLVIVMIYKFYRINKLAGLLQIPYALWLVFASILNFYVYILN